VVGHGVSRRVTHDTHESRASRSGRTSPPSPFLLQLFASTVTCGPFQCRAGPGPSDIVFLASATWSIFRRPRLEVRLRNGSVYTGCLDEITAFAVFAERGFHGFVRTLFTTAVSYRGSLQVEWQTRRRGKWALICP
jgi:hypothetical protein